MDKDGQSGIFCKAQWPPIDLHSALATSLHDLRVASLTLLLSACMIQVNTCRKPILYQHRDFSRAQFVASLPGGHYERAANTEGASHAVGARGVMGERCSGA